MKGINYFFLPCSTKVAGDYSAFMTQRSMKDIVVTISIFFFLSLLSLKAQDNGNVPVWRVQVRLSTCNTDDADTDDGVYAELRNGNQTFLNYPHDDFGRNSNVNLRSDRLMEFPLFVISDF